MADPKQEKKQKDANSEGTGFKTVMGGFDKNEVNLYINKLRKQMKEQMEEYERRLSNMQTNLEDANREAAKAKNDKKTAEQAAATAAAPIIKDSSEETKKLIDDLKAESDKKIMELRKSILDERRNVAKFDKECAMAKMSEKKVREEYDKLKEKYLNLKKNGGGSAPAGKPVTTSNADEVMAEAASYAKEIVAAAKQYASDAVKAADKYKAEVEAELNERAKKLDSVKAKLDEQIRKTETEQAESSKKVKEISSKIGALTSLFESFTTQFNSVNSQITGVTENIGNICKQFNETTGQIDTVAKQITETTSQIDTVSKQINETSGQIAGFAKTINETTEKINETSKKMTETTGIITETSKKMSETSGLIGEASKKMNGFSDALSDASSDISGITMIVDETKSKLDSAQSSVSEAQSAADAQASAADLSPIAKIGEEISAAVGAITAKLVLPDFDDSKFTDARFEAIKKKLKIETTIEQDDSASSSIVDDDDDFLDEGGIISSLEIDSPDTGIPSDDDLMADVPDVITAPKFEESAPEPAKKPEPEKAAPKAPKAPDKSEMAERPGLDSDFEDFFLTEPKDDDMSGDIPLINMEGVGVMDDFSLDPVPEASGADFDIAPIDKNAKPDKGDDLGAEIFDIAIDPAGADDDTLANMMADAAAAEKAANKDLTPEDMGFDADETLDTGASDDFGEFAELFAAGSSQTSDSGSKKTPAFGKSSTSWNNGGDSDPDSSLSADDDLSSLLL